MRNKAEFASVDAGSQFPTAGFEALNVRHVDDVDAVIQLLYEGVLRVKSFQASGYYFKCGIVIK